MGRVEGIGTVRHGKRCNQHHARDNEADEHAGACEATCFVFCEASGFEVHLLTRLVLGVSGSGKDFVTDNLLLVDLKSFAWLTAEVLN